MNQIIPIPHGMFDGMQGQNDEIDGAISFALEAMGGPDFDYWMIAGLTGDSFNQIYYRDRWRGNSAAEVRMSNGDVSPVLEIFAADTTANLSPEGNCSSIAKSIWSGSCAPSTGAFRSFCTAAAGR